MALPREPRQKMINMMYLVLTALLALNVAAEILNAFKTVNRSLETTNQTVNASTDQIMKSLNEKTKEPETMVRANEWLPRAQAVVNESKSLYDYIQSLKAQILKAADGDINDPNKKFKEDNLDVATHLMVEKGEGKKLLGLLTDYKSKVLAIDPSIKKEFENSLPIDLSKPPTTSKGNNTWEAAYFRMVPTVAALTILSKFQNDVKTTENKIVSFCHNKVGEVKIVFDSYAAIVGQNSNYLMPGEEITINAGIGAFSKDAKPTIQIGNSTVPIGPEGFAEMKIAGGGLGEHSVPVRISYFNQFTGKDEIVERTVKYKVGQANASIALDEMNVLYIGYDNKVSIAASGGGDDRVTATITGGGGQLIKTGSGKYIARVNTVSDDVKITVAVDGKVAGVSQFRVRTIPQPVGTVGGYASGENVPAGAFKAQSGVGAYIKDFPLNLKYEVVSFTITADDAATGDILEENVTGNLWSPRAQNIVRNLKAGGLVTIDNLRAKGPDNRVQKLPSLVYYIK
ncbi:MAG: gliding motility protein GldM [Chitinophagaceae bacterium]